MGHWILQQARTLVRGTRQACVHAAGLAVRPGLDRALCIHRSCGLAHGARPATIIRDASVVGSARLEFCVDADLLFSTSDRLCARDPDAVGDRQSGVHRDDLENRPRIRVAIHSVCCVDGVRHGVEWRHFRAELIFLAYILLAEFALARNLATREAPTRLKEGDAPGVWPCGAGRPPRP